MAGVNPRQSFRDKARHARFPKPSSAVTRAIIAAVLETCRRMTKAAQDESPLPTAEVLTAEYRALIPPENAAELDTRLTDASEEEIRAESHRAAAVALCLSGGGIRSASFCLGVVQGLAKRGLRQVPYLSTVSGGGYLGSLLAAWIYRTPNGVHDVEAALKDGAAGGVDPVAWLRNYLSYLA